MRCIPPPQYFDENTEGGSFDFITKGDKSLDPSNLFGMWANKPRLIEAIRQQGWQRNVNL